jgi:acyl carrier protein
MRLADQILSIIFEAIDEINDQYLEKGKVERSLDAKLYQPGSALDSLGLVNLIVATEQRIEEQFGVSLILADEKVSLESSPFKTVGAFADYVAQRLNDPSR